MRRRWRSFRPPLPASSLPWHLRPMRGPSFSRFFRLFLITLDDLLLHLFDHFGDSALRNFFVGPTADNLIDHLHCVLGDLFLPPPFFLPLRLPPLFAQGWVTDDASRHSFRGLALQGLFFLDLLDGFLQDLLLLRAFRDLLLRSLPLLRSLLRLLFRLLRLLHCLLSLLLCGRCAFLRSLLQSLLCLLFAFFAFFFVFPFFLPSSFFFSL